MPVLASRSLWEQAAQTLASANTTFTTVTAVPNQATVGTPVTVSLFSQSLTSQVPSTAPNNPNYFVASDLAANPVLVLRLPDNSQAVLQTTTSPAIAHTALSGIYSVTVNTFQTGLYRASWYSSTGEPLGSVEIWILGPVVP